MEHKRVRRVPVGKDPAPVPESVRRVLESAGQPLDDAVRATVERRFGRDFSGIRVHADADAAESAREVGAHAYTVGEHIAFGANRYDPATVEGRRLLAHEIAHAVQQGRGGAVAPPEPGSALDRVADRAAAEFSTGTGPVTVAGSSAPSLARQVDPTHGSVTPAEPTEASEEYRKGYEHGLSGQQKVVAARPGMDDYNRGYVKGLDARLRDADSKKNWRVVAEVLNAFNTDDILARLTQRSVQDLMAIEGGAWDNTRVGKNSQIALLTHDLVAAVHPQAYSPGEVFPNNFGDKLGGVGAVVVGAAVGALALRLAAPLLMNYWRQITLGSGLAKIAAESEKEEAEIAGMDLEAAVQRLMNDPGGRILVTYQSGSPAADRELYLTSQEGAQYAEAVAQGRNLYQLRIPERMFQLLERRQLVEVRQGSMGNQVGVDIRISEGAMRFLSRYIKQIPIKDQP
ncbi:DUF4157 domain-containing protein [Kitasatospora sp. NPDC048239]|uniref:eCIS core domain-containing protein n=1 Tax=Kitasatospora sp. NPDC048239 TaxID=3364046 RepID=UPI00371747CB